MSALPPNPPPGVPPQTPHWPGAYAAPRESRGVSFFVAIFLGLLLLVSGALNVLLLLVSLGSLAGGGIGDLDAASFDEAHVAGARDERHKVLQIPLRGAIAEGGNPVLGAAGGSVSAVARALRQAGRDDSVDGVLFLIDSPGGGVTDSDEIHAEILRFRAEHPRKKVMALFGDIAASGGYYVAVATEHIVARTTTITGSIGVIMSAWNFAEAAKKWGVDQVAIKSARTPYKDMLSPTRAMTDEERAMLTGIVDELLDRFVQVVDEGRPNLDREQVLACATGAIFTARQAKERGLVDDIGDHTTALRWFERQLGHPVRIVEPRRRPGLADLFLGAFGPDRAEGNAIQRLLTASSGPRFLYYWEGGR